MSIRTTPAVILDTNVFVAAAFNPESASAQILARVRSGRLRLVWNEQTRRETQRILSRIRPLWWSGLADLFREEDRFCAETSSEKFDYLPDVDDRKFAALSAATGVVLITSDDDLLSNRDRAGLEILTPREYLASCTL